MDTVPQELDDDAKARAETERELREDPLRYAATFVDIDIELGRVEPQHRGIMIRFSALSLLGEHDEAERVLRRYLERFRRCPRPRRARPSPRRRAASSPRPRARARRRPARTRPGTAAEDSSSRRGGRS